MHELRTITAEIAVPEKEIADIRLGQRILLKARAYPGLDFRGAVTAIAPVASRTNDWRNERTVLVVTQLENSSLLLKPEMTVKPEMTGVAKIYCGERRACELLARRSIRYLRVEFLVVVVNRGERLVARRELHAAAQQHFLADGRSITLLEQDINPWVAADPAEDRLLREL